MIDKFSPVFEFKAQDIESSGTFAGYASTFGGQPDSFGDIIAPGAFTKSLADHQSKGAAPALLWAHDSSEPIGKWTSLTEDRHGLAVTGKLTLATKRGSEAHALMKDDALGLSIGFRVADQGAAYQGSTRILKGIELFEISAVAMPANPSARVTGVKSAGFMRPDNIREFEAALRDACGFTVREAKRIASVGWPALTRRDDTSDELAQITAAFKRAATDFQLK
jgi:HK97 family phage prohead protease